MVIDLHPGIAAVVLLILAWFTHVALRPCRCCRHHPAKSDEF